MIGLLLMALVACSSKSSDSNGTPGVTADGANVDLSALPLEQALKTKYSSLILTCVEAVSVKSVTGEEFTSTSAPEFIWDMLENFKPHKTVVMDRKVKDLQYQIVMELEPELYTGTVTFDNSGVTYTLHQAAAINGAVHSMVKLNQTVLQHGAESPGMTKFYEGLETDVINTANSGPHESYSVRVVCKIEADLQPEYSHNH